MEKLQRHLDTQAKKAVKQVAKRMLANKTSCGVFAEQVARCPVMCPHESPCSWLGFSAAPPHRTLKRFGGSCFCEEAW
jgi:hypothetical protein